MSKSFERLYRQLNYTFKKEAYLKQALTHCSVGPQNNERFEFLGDAILSFVIAHALFQQFPKNTEGELSRLRAFLVKGDMLTEIALEIELGNYLYLGQGELKSGGFRRSSILSDAMEAVFAAVLLDGGMSACQEVILHLYQKRLADPQLTNNLKDAKTQLQEILQAKKCPLPTYTLTNVQGDEHDQRFYVTCHVAQLNLSAEGVGEVRRKAEQEAAKLVLGKLKR